MSFKNLDFLFTFFLTSFYNMIVYCAEIRLTLNYLDITQQVKDNQIKFGSKDIFNGLTSFISGGEKTLSESIGVSKISSNTLYDEIIGILPNKKIKKRIFMISLKNPDQGSNLITIGPNFNKFDEGLSIEFSKTDGDKYDEYVKKLINTSVRLKKYLRSNADNGSEVNIYYVIIDNKNTDDEKNNTKKTGCCKKN